MLLNKETKINQIYFVNLRERECVWGVCDIVERKREKDRIALESV